MQSYLGRILPGAFLVHVHTPHGGIVFSITVHLTAPSAASLNVTVSPSTCGPVSINGTAYASGSVATNPIGVVSLSAPLCAGHPFHVWTERGGGVSFGTPFRAGSNATLYYNSSLTATYT
jgi:hypothetical protein